MTIGRKGLTIKASKGMTSRVTQKGKGGGNRRPNLYIKDNEINRVQFFTDLDGFVEFDEHQFKEGNNWCYVPCIGDNCPLDEDEDTAKARPRYKAVANVYSHDQDRVYVVEISKTLGSLIFNRRERDGDGEGGSRKWLSRVYEIERLDTQPKTFSFAVDPDTDKIDLKDKKPYDLQDYIKDKVIDYYGEDLNEVSALEDERAGAEEFAAATTSNPSTDDGPPWDNDDEADDLDSLDDLAEEAQPSAEAPKAAARRSSRR